MDRVYQHLIDLNKKGPGYLVLLDPEREENVRVAGVASQNGADALLIGGSTFHTNNIEEFVTRVKEKTNLPLILFPGSKAQLSKRADALFFLSLISGRNPELLIGEHVRAALEIKRLRLETIPVGYILVDSGNPTSVVKESDTQPISRGDVEGVRAHALAAQYLGMKMVYLEGGSGAPKSVPLEMIQEVKKEISIPLIVGGGIRTPPEAKEMILAGADFIVTGNAIEEDPSKIKEFADVIKQPAISTQRSAKN